MAMPKVSIIVPIYNVKEYMGAAVESAMNQTERDIEIILVDDGSTDGSGALCDAYAQKDSRIQVIHKENGGLSSARNAGISAAQGKYVLLLDGDDFLLPHTAARVLAQMEDTPSDIIQFHYKEVAAGEKVQPGEMQKALPAASTSKELFYNLYALGGEGASACTKLFRREVLEQIPFETIRHEDEMWCSRAFAKPLTVTYIPDVLYCYVMRPNSIIHAGFNPGRLEIFRVIDARIDVLKKLTLPELLTYEYRKAFLSILMLYRDAANAKDSESLLRIRKEFNRYKKEIKQYAKLTGKFKLLFRFMCLNFNAAELYRVYWKLGL